MQACINCGEYKPHKGHGLCVNCYYYWRKHGEMRTTSTHDELQSATHCVNCGTKTQKGERRRGLCKACASFFYTHKRMRTSVDQLCKPGGLCSDCGDKTAIVKGLCGTCYNYRWTHGVKRPLLLRTQQCVNCKRPLSPRSGGRLQKRGMCNSCYRYQYRYGSPRPARLFGISEFGWCDCGQPARFAVTVKIYHHAETLPLCDACHAEYQRQVAWYGDSHQQKVGKR